MTVELSTVVLTQANSNERHTDTTATTEVWNNDRLKQINVYFYDYQILPRLALPYLECLAE